MEMMKMKINPLPVRTWHWTGMNDSELKIEDLGTAPEFSLEGQAEGLQWMPAYEPAARSGAADPDSWGDMETGMGDDFAGWMRQRKTALLDIPAGYRHAKSTILTVDSKDEQSAGQLLLHAGCGSEASLIVVIRGDGQNCCTADTAALQLMVQAEADAKMKLFVIQMISGAAQGCLNIGGICKDRSEVELVQLSLGAKASYIGIAMRQQGEESKFSGDLGYRVHPAQSVDINYVVRQEGRGTKSSLNAWGVLEDGARKVFRGTIDFKEGCAGSAGTEQEDVLLLGEHQVNRTIPLILCHEEDVEGNHGATIGRLDEQMLFYLASRGVDPKTAENLIAQARLEALINRIPDSKIRRGAEEMAGGKEMWTNEL